MSQYTGRLKITVQVVLDPPSTPDHQLLRDLNAIQNPPVYNVAETSVKFALPDLYKHNGARCTVGDVRKDGTCWLNNVECK